MFSEKVVNFTRNQISMIDKYSSLLVEEMELPNIEFEKTYYNVDNCMNSKTKSLIAVKFLELFIIAEMDLIQNIIFFIL